MKRLVRKLICEIARALIEVCNGRVRWISRWAYSHIRNCEHCRDFINSTKALEKLLWASASVTKIRPPSFVRLCIKSKLLSSVRVDRDFTINLKPRFVVIAVLGVLVGEGLNNYFSNSYYRSKAEGIVQLSCDIISISPQIVYKGTETLLTYSVDSYLKLSTEIEQKALEIANNTLKFSKQLASSLLIEDQ